MASLFSQVKVGSEGLAALHKDFQCQAIGGMETNLEEAGGQRECYLERKMGVLERVVRGDLHRK